MNELARDFLYSYTSQGRQKINAIFGQMGVTVPRMSRECRVLVGIPAYYAEQGLERTLRTYSNQENLQSFEVLVLVNGPSAVDFDQSRAYQDTLNAMAKFPDLRIDLATGGYKPGISIGRLRRDIAALSILRANQARVDDFVMITNDADLWGFGSNDYVTRIIQKFDQNQRLAGLAGDVLYPRKSYKTNHLHALIDAVQRRYARVQRERDGYTLFPGGNSAFRLSSYLRIKGHDEEDVIGENRTLYKILRRDDPQSVSYEEDIKLVTSPRRQLAAISHDEPVVDRHRNFGDADDRNRLYSIPPEKIRSLPSKGRDIADATFAQDFVDELEAFFRHQSRTIRRITDTHFIDKLVILQDDIKAVCGGLGIKFEFIDGHVVGIDLSKVNMTKIIKAETIPLSDN